MRYLHTFKFPKYQWELIKNKGEGLKGYGYNLNILKDGKQVAVMGAFINESMAVQALKDYILFWEFNIERD